MATPITWQNVQGRSLAEAATPLQYAAQNIGSAFDKLGGVYKDYQTQQQKQVDMAAEANVQGFLERLQNVRSPEEVAALQASGELASLRAGLRPQDLAKVRGAEDARVTALMQQTTAKNTFDDVLAKRAAEPIFEAFRLAGLNKDDATQARLLAENPQLRWADLVANDQALERKQAEQKRLDELAPLTHANSLGALKETNLGLAEKESTRALDAVIAQELQKRTEAEKTKLGAFPKVPGFFPSTPGSTNPAPTSAEEAYALNESILRGGQGITTTPATSDTATADAVVENLRNNSNFSPAFIENNLERIRSAFDSTRRDGKVGNDALAASRDAAKEQVYMEDLAKGGWTAPGTADTRRAYEELAKEVPALIDKNTGSSPEEDILPIQNKLTELAIKGVEVEKGVFVTPSVNEVRAALRGAEGGSWWALQGDGYRAKKFEEILKANMKKEDIAKRLEDSEVYKKYSRKRAVQEIVGAKK